MARCTCDTYQIGGSSCGSRVFLNIRSPNSEFIVRFLDEVKLATRARSAPEPMPINLRATLECSTISHSHRFIHFIRLSSVDPTPIRAKNARTMDPRVPGGFPAASPVTHRLLRRVVVVVADTGRQDCRRH
jgi:hypothetical protein